MIGTILDSGWASPALDEALFAIPATFNPP